MTPNLPPLPSGVPVALSPDDWPKEHMGDFHALPASGRILAPEEP